MSARIPVQIGEGGDESALRHLVHINARVTSRGHPGPDGEFVTGHHDPEGLGVASAGPADGLLSLSVGRTWIAIHHLMMAEGRWGLPPGTDDFWGNAQEGYWGMCGSGYSGGWQGRR
jgi:hypothetical protein